MSGTPFSIINAFTTDPYGGNPAAVVIVQEFPDSTTMLNIAKNFNQPMTSFIRQVASNSEVVTFDVRWFTVLSEAPLCGHATLAASKLVFSTPELAPSSVIRLEFRTATGKIVTARRDGEWIEITMATTVPEALSSEDSERLKAVISGGLGKDVSVKFVGVGGEGFESFMLAEIEEADDLAGCKPNPSAFLASGYRVNVITSSSSDPNVAFVSRMFSPATGILEDHVCGSAHCLLGPYWSKNSNRGDARMLAKQVSPRGGDLKVVWRQADGLLALAGQARIIMKGELV